MKMNWAKAANNVGDFMVKQAGASLESERDKERIAEQARLNGQNQMNYLREKQRLDTEQAAQQKKIDNEESLGRMAGQLFATNSSEIVSQSPDAAHINVFTGSPPSAEMVESGSVQGEGDYLNALSSVRAAAEKTSSQLKEYGYNVPTDSIMRGHLEATLKDKEAAKQAMKAEAEYRRKRADKKADAADDAALDIKKDEAKEKRASAAQDARYNKLIELGYTHTEASDEAYGVKAPKSESVPDTTIYQDVAAKSAQNRIDMAAANLKAAKDARANAEAGKGEWFGTDSDDMAATAKAKADAEQERLAAEKAFAEQEKKFKNSTPKRRELVPKKKVQSTIPPGARTGIDKATGRKVWSIDGGKTINYAD